jgi:hypothetical protein
MKPISVPNDCFTLLTADLQTVNIKAHIERGDTSTSEANIKPAVRVGYIRFEVFTAVTLKNGVFWDVMPCGSCNNGRFGVT